MYKMPEIRKRIPTEAIKPKKGSSEISFRVVGEVGAAKWRVHARGAFGNLQKKS